MIINCIYITKNSFDTYTPEIANIWVGLSNWIPFFFCFWAFQPFLNDPKLRIKTSKLLIFGSLPVLLSGFCQYFLDMYGPYYFLNNLIIWYQRPLKDGAVTGLFNNPNYAAAWLCIILPLCISFLVFNNKKKIINLFVFLACLSFIFMIILTTSRSAILSIFISIFLLTKSFKAKSYVLLTFFSIPILLNLIPTISLTLQSIIYNFLPYGLIKKASLINLSNSDLFPRLEIWAKSINLIKSNLLTGYGAGSFESLYSTSDGMYHSIQHSHNIFLEIAISHGIPASLIILSTMLFITIFSWINTSNIPINNFSNIYIKMKIFDRAWIIAFITFFLIHIFDITYFDGRISSLAWILLSGMTSIIKEKSDTAEKI